MTSELITNLTTLLDRWDTLATAATQRVETSTQPIQASFYAGVLFGMGVSRDELTEVLASAMAEAAKSTTGFMKSTEQLSN